jgi:hypothetical protein
MSFSQYETSRQLGEPVELFRFAYGATPAESYNYTDAEETIVNEAISHTPLPIERGAINASGTLDKAALDIRVPASSQVAQLFIQYPPDQNVSLVIKAGHADDPANEFLAVWTGRVVNAKFEGLVCTLSCEPYVTLLRKAGLRRHYQLGCPHALYSTFCGASQAAATVVRNVVSFSGSTLEFAPGWNVQALTKYVGGMIMWPSGAPTVRRTILRLPSATAVLIAGPPSGLAAGQAVDVVLGCNHQMDDCASIHNNINNFGGQPYIPLKSPIQNASLY